MDKWYSTSDRGVVFFLCAASDAALALFAGLLSAWVIDAAGHLPLWPLPDFFELPLLMGALLLPTANLWLGTYQSLKDPAAGKVLALSLLSVVILAALLAVGALATKTGTYLSRTWLALWLFFTATTVLVHRWAMRHLLRILIRRGVGVIKVALLGGGTLAQRVAYQVRNNRHMGFELIGFYAAREEERSEKFLPCLGMMNELANSSLRLDQVWIALRLRDEALMREFLHLMRHSVVDVRLIPDLTDFRLLNYSMDTVAGLPLLNISYSPLSGPARLFKDVTDRILAGFFLALLAPLMLLIATLIRQTSPGPALFRQLRHGQGGRPFMMYKFRTMQVSKEVPHQPYQQAQRHDPRVTRVGSWLRRSSLDELPQFLNVLKGEMSVIGPRPHPVAMNDLWADQLDRYMFRHKVKPGLTGWAQVNGFRGETDTEEKMRQRIQHDLYYIEHWSLWLDIKILFMTLRVGFFHHNAY